MQLKAARLVRKKMAAVTEAREIVVAVAVRMPKIEKRLCDWLAGRGYHKAGEMQRRTPFTRFGEQ